LTQSEENPKIYIARSPKEFLIPLLEKESKRIKEGLEALTELEVIHQSMEYVKRAESLRSKVLRYSPRSAVAHKLEELIRESHRRIVILTTANGLIRLSKIADLLYERFKLGLKIDIFSSIRDEPVFSTAVQSLNEIESCVISFLPSAIPVQIISIDSRYLLVCELKPDDLKDDGMDVAFLIQNAELADMMESLIRAIGPQMRGQGPKQIVT
jgi:hypothetical protein